jgi:NACalpha-BTF3-like transcription factor
MSDSYTVKQTALALGVSEKRVRQMIREGKLKQLGSDPVTVSQEEVLELRSKRELSSRVVKARTDKQNAFIDSVKLLIEQTSLNHQRAITALEESSKRIEENYQRQLNELKAENDKLKEDLNRKRRGLFRRG